MQLTSPAIAAALALSLPASLAAQQSSGDGAMTDITCEEFLGLPASDQEMHATALTTARMDEAASASAEAGDVADQETEAEPDEGEARPKVPAMPTDGITSNILSPTVVALVTICENSVDSPENVSGTGTAGGTSDGNGNGTASGTAN